MLIIGLGDIIEADNNTLLAIQAEVAVNFGSETLSVPAGDSSSNIVVQTAQPVTGTFRFRSVNSGILVALTAGASVVSDGAGATAYRYEKQSIVVPTTPWQITPSPTIVQVGGDTVLGAIPANADPLSVVTDDGTPVTGEVDFTSASGQLTFVVANEGDVVDLTYFSAEVAGVNRVFTLTPSALPPAAHYVVGLKLFSQYTGVFKTGGIVLDLAKVTRTSEAGPIGATVGDTGQIGFDWEAINTTTGDVKIYTASEGIHQ